MTLQRHFFRDMISKLEGLTVIEKIRNLITKYYDILAYLFFGVLTTAVNYIVYLPC